MTPIYGAHLVSFERFSWPALVVFDLSGAFFSFFVEAKKNLEVAKQALLKRGCGKKFLALSPIVDLL